jgi:hypothetical protein
LLLQYQEILLENKDFIFLLVVNSIVIEEEIGDSRTIFIAICIDFESFRVVCALKNGVLFMLHIVAL